MPTFRGLVGALNGKVSMIHALLLDYQNCGEAMALRAWLNSFARCGKSVLSDTIGYDIADWHVRLVW